MSEKTTSVKIMRIAFLLSLLGMLAIIFAVFATKSDDKKAVKEESYISLDNSFFLTPDGDKVADLSHLGQYASEESNMISLYYRLPEITNNTTLIYRSKDVYTSLYLEDTLIYETNVSESRFYNKSPGNLWNRVNLDSSCSGKLLTLNIDMVYGESAVTADHFYLGDGISIITDFIRSKFVALLISIAMILIGIYMLLLDLFSRFHKSHSTHGLLYLGIYALLVGIWCFLEANILQFFIADQRIIQLINNMVMITDIAPLFFYLDCEYKALKNPVVKVLCVADVVYIIFCIVAQITGICDFHDLLIGSQLALFVGNLTVVSWIVSVFIKFRKKKMDTTALGLYILGVGLLLATALGELVRYKYTSYDTMDRASSLRLGILLFIIFFGWGNQIQTSRLVKQGLKYDIVKELAYSDGLTSMGNRTSFLEKLSFYASSDVASIGIVFLDVNDLKLTNDTRGHEIGDKLLLEATSIIQNSFGKYGDCYRIGGDEFCVLMEGNDIESMYEEGRECFNKLIEASHNNELDLNIQIAHGFTIGDATTVESIDNAIDIADKLMYRDKEKLKEIAKSKK
ncbi:MAG: GGDEF domain-containing protein [Agathobacter sp.]|nr:GGDEF domain-containing protein [Agathobacter sp.]